MRKQAEMHRLMSKDQTQRGVEKKIGRNRLGEQYLQSTLAAKGLVTQMEQSGREPCRCCTEKQSTPPKPQAF
jgi:hypothetical protein